MENIERFKSHLTAIGDSIRAKTGGTDKIPFDKLSEEIGKIETMPEMFILEDEDGNQLAAVLTDEPIELTADKKTDIRIGTTAVTSEGVVQGEKEIPAYHVTEGTKVIPNNSAFLISIPNYDYTKLQAILTPYKSSLADSVASDRVVINGKVYPVQSNVSEASVTINDELKRIELGLVNSSGSPCIIRYFSYKEIY